MIVSYIKHTKTKYKLTKRKHKSWQTKTYRRLWNDVNKYSHEKLLNKTYKQLRFFLILEFGLFTYIYEIETKNKVAKNPCEYILLITVPMELTWEMITVDE